MREHDNKTHFSTVFEERHNELNNDTKVLVLPYTVFNVSETEKLHLRASIIHGNREFYKIPSNETCASQRWENDLSRVSTYEFMHFDNKDLPVVLPNCSAPANESMFWVLVAILIAAVTGLAAVTCRTLCPKLVELEIVNVNGQ